MDLSATPLVNTYTLDAPLPATAVAAVPNLFNGTGVAIATFPGPSAVNLRVQCGVTATGQ